MASQGDPRVLLAMNVVLSTVFSAVVTWGLSFVGLVEYTLRNVALLAIVLFGLTYLVTMR